ncbi:MAG: LuxR C-terminal-related transcriptional regulator [Leifsonia sp.]|uniref:helix-turn-helix transcriptional regulator n=1 Tax=Leifsonia sp. TaxID=1870902 RepID=UPI003F7F7956
MPKKDPVFIGRSEELDIVVGLLSGRTSVDVVGERASGRTAFLTQLEARLQDDGWSVIQLRGIASLREQAFAALHLAGVGAPTDARGTSTLQVTANALRQLTDRPRSVLFIDDWDDLDETSWGVVEAVRRETGLPMVRARLRGLPARHTPTGLSAAGLEPVIVVDMAPLRFDDLERALQEAVGGPIDGGTMSRLYAKSGGSIGLALSIAEVAQNEKRMERGADGRWYAARDLWSPALSAMVEAHLEHLDPEARDGLETIALLGVADLETVRRLVGWTALEQLEESAAIAVVPAGDRQLVTIIPPLVVEFFRHQPPNLRRERITDAIVEKLGPEVVLDAMLSRERATDRPPGHGDAVMVRLLRERDRTSRIVARAEWEDTRSPEPAVRYLQTILNTAAPAPDIERVMIDTDIEAGAPEARALFVRLRARWQAYVCGDPDRALGELGALAADVGAFAPMLEAERLTIAMHAGKETPTAASVPTVDDGMPAVVQLALLETRMLLHLARGEFSAVASLYARAARWAPGGGSCYLRAYAGLADIALGRLDDAVEDLMRGLDEARGLLDAEAVRAHAAAAACAFVAAGDYDAVDAVLDIAFAAGEPSPFVPGITTLLLTCAVLVNVRRGNAAAGERHLRMLSGIPCAEGPLPGQSAVMARAQSEAVAHPGRAAALLSAEAQSQWDRGNRFAACYAGLAALEISFDPARLEATAAWVDEVGGGLLEARQASLAALAAHDAGLLMASMERLEASGQCGAALRAARKAAMVFAERRDTVGFEQAREAERRLTARKWPRRIFTEGFSASASVLSDREREVARLVAEGHSNPDIAGQLVLSVRTVESHVHHILRKLEIPSRQLLKFYVDRL